VLSRVGGSPRPHAPVDLHQRLVRAPACRPSAGSPGLEHLAVIRPGEDLERLLRRAGRQLLQERGRDPLARTRPAPRRSGRPPRPRARKRPKTSSRAPPTCSTSAPGSASARSSAIRLPAARTTSSVPPPRRAARYPQDARGAHIESNIPLGQRPACPRRRTAPGSPRCCCRPSARSRNGGQNLRRGPPAREDIVGVELELEATDGAYGMSRAE